MRNKCGTRKNWSRFPRYFPSLFFVFSEEASLRFWGPANQKKSLDSLGRRASSFYLTATMTRRNFLLALLLGCSILATASDKRYFEHLAKGDEYYRSFDNASALLEYEQAYKLAPSDPEVLVRMIRIHNDIGRLLPWRSDSAETWYNKALEYAEDFKEKFPDRAEAHFWMALTRGSLVSFRGTQEKLEIGKAVERYARKAVEIDSTFGPAYVILGIIYREAARLRWYERLIANVVFGGSLPGTIEDSERVLQKAIDLNRNDLFAHYELSRTYSYLENKEKTIEHLRLALEVRPANLRERAQLERAKRQLESLLLKG